MFDFKAHAKHRPLIMGVVNVTPDSFSDGGAYDDCDKAVSHAVSLIRDGADIVDIGGESTRPHAEIVAPADEIKRVFPVIAALKSQTHTVSLDTRNAATMQVALDCDVDLINDVSALTHDPDAVHVVSQGRIPICLMHMQGTPQTMQNAPRYKNVVDDVIAFFDERLAFCARHGIQDENIILDVGIGFGKTLEHNLALLQNLERFRTLGRPILLGVSRKSFIHAIADVPCATDRLGGSLAAALYAAGQGAVDILRVHDVAQTAQALKVYDAIAAS